MTDWQVDERFLDFVVKKFESDSGLKDLVGATKPLVGAGRKEYSMNDLVDEMKQGTRIGKRLYTTLYEIYNRLLEGIMKDFQKGNLDRVSFPQRSNPFERSDLEAQRQNAYFEQHWPEYRDRAIADLRASLGSKQPVAEQKLNSGKTLELRVGDNKDADNINMRDHEFYSTTALAFGRDNTSFFRITSFSDSPLEPVGFYFVMNYFENDEHWTKKDHEGQRKVGEGKLIYVSPSARGYKLRSILTADSALEILDDKSNDVLRFEVANEKVGHILTNLGFRPVGKATYGYDDFKIDLSEREIVRQIFQKYLGQFVQAPSPNQ